MHPFYSPTGILGYVKHVINKKFTAREYYIGISNARKRRPNVKLNIVYV